MMEQNKIKIGKLYKFNEIFSLDSCKNCNPCSKLIFLEYGLGGGDTIRILSKSHGFYKIQVENYEGSPYIKLALREKELESMIFDKSICTIVSE